MPITGIFSRNEIKLLRHSPCILNLDDFGKLGTHWVCCWKGKDIEYFDSFGLPPPDEWQQEMRKTGRKAFLRNDNQIQSTDSVRCGWYCLLLLNERNKGVSFRDILKRFSGGVHENERVVKNYFLHI